MENFIWIINNKGVVISCEEIESWWWVRATANLSTELSKIEKTIITCHHKKKR